MNDTDERSCALRGSRGEPVAWAVLRIDGSAYDVYRTEEEAKAIDEAVTGNHGVVPLYSDATRSVMPEQLDALIQAMERVQALEAEVARLRLTDGERHFLERCSDASGSAGEAARSILRRFT